MKPPRWLRTRRDFPRATSTSSTWCRADGEGVTDLRWTTRTAAHRAVAASMTRSRAYDTRWSA